jgi:hypothetical protein
MRVKQTQHRTVGRHANHHPPAGRKPSAMVCVCINGHEACPIVTSSLIPVVIDDQHSAATG